MNKRFVDILTKGIKSRRMDIIKWLMDNPENSFTITEIYKKMNLNLNLIRKDLNELKKYGLIIENSFREKDINKKESRYGVRYQINKENSFVKMLGVEDGKNN